MLKCQIVLFSNTLKQQNGPLECHREIKGWLIDHLQLHLLTCRKDVVLPIAACSFNTHQICLSESQLVRRYPSTYRHFLFVPKPLQMSRAGAWRHQAKLLSDGSPDEKSPGPSRLKSSQRANTTEASRFEDDFAKWWEAAALRHGENITFRKKYVHVHRLGADFYLTCL